MSGEISSVKLDRQSIFLSFHPTVVKQVVLKRPNTLSANLADIERVAETCDRSRSWVMVRALKMYLGAEGADILAVRRGREQVADGDVHDMDDVLGEISGIINRKVA